MSFPSSFGSQVAAIMDVLAKAAVAEITKLVEDGTVVLRLEMCRRDSEIQELKRSLKLMEVELCKAQEAATSRANGNVTEDTQQPTVTAAVQVDREGEKHQLVENRHKKTQYKKSKRIVLICLLQNRPCLIGHNLRS